MKVDKDKFDALLRRLLQTRPQEGKTIMAGPERSSSRDNWLWTRRMLATPNGSLTPDPRGEKGEV
jgi:hypothetical protein